MGANLIQLKTRPPIHATHWIQPSSWRLNSYSSWSRHYSFSTGSQEILLPTHTTSQSTPKREGPYSQPPHSKRPWWRQTTALQAHICVCGRWDKCKKINLRSYLISHAFHRFRFPQGTLTNFSSIHWSHPPQSCLQRVWIFISKTFRYSEISASLSK